MNYGRSTLIPRSLSSVCPGVRVVGGKGGIASLCEISRCGRLWQVIGRFGRMEEEEDDGIVVQESLQRC
ncbi:hypothetical protein LX36DRAFT_371317 [Colletotrichum falcatum]|nr:hypothetical protein LX36DRAFT_371317 [Colletotrichum falcatum]